jgi:hypothetical protein
LPQSTRMLSHLQVGSKPNDQKDLSYVYAIQILAGESPIFTMRLCLDYPLVLQKSSG